MNAGNLDEAEAAFKEALKEKPNDEAAKRGLNRVQQQKKDNEAANRKAEDAAQKNKEAKALKAPEGHAPTLANDSPKTINATSQATVCRAG